MLTGSCLCGAIAYEVDAPASAINYCNCGKCRKASGSAFAANVSVPRDAFRWVRGQDAVRSYESSPGKVRRFCGQCGSPLIAERPATAAAPVRLRIGCLDSPIPNPAFIGHIWRSEASDWFDPKQPMPEWPEFAPPQA
jgi:hypothetical protein